MEGLHPLISLLPELTLVDIICHHPTNLGIGGGGEVAEEDDGMPITDEECRSTEVLVYLAMGAKCNLAQDLVSSGNIIEWMESLNREDGVSCLVHRNAGLSLVRISQWPLHDHIYLAHLANPTCTSVT